METEDERTKRLHDAHMQKEAMLKARKAQIANLSPDIKAKMSPSPLGKRENLRTPPKAKKVLFTNERNTSTPSSAGLASAMKRFAGIDLVSGLDAEISNDSTIYVTNQEIRQDNPLLQDYLFRSDVQMELLRSEKHQQNRQAHIEVLKERFNEEYMVDLAPQKTPYYQEAFNSYANQKLTEHLDRNPSKYMSDKDMIAFKLNLEPEFVKSVQFKEVQERYTEATKQSWLQYLESGLLKFDEEYLAAFNLQDVDKVFEPAWLVLSDIPENERPLSPQDVKEVEKLKHEDPDFEEARKAQYEALCSKFQRDYGKDYVLEVEQERRQLIQNWYQDLSEEVRKTLTTEDLRLQAWNRQNGVMVKYWENEYRFKLIMVLGLGLLEFYMNYLKEKRRRQVTAEEVREKIPWMSNEGVARKPGRKESLRKEEPGQRKLTAQSFKKVQDAETYWIQFDDTFTFENIKAFIQSLLKFPKEAIGQEVNNILSYLVAFFKIVYTGPNTLEDFLLSKFDQVQNPDLKRYYQFLDQREAMKFELALKPLPLAVSDLLNVYLKEFNIIRTAIAKFHVAKVLLEAFEFSLVQDFVKFESQYVIWAKNNPKKVLAKKKDRNLVENQRPYDEKGREEFIKHYSLKSHLLQDLHNSLRNYTQNNRNYDVLKIDFIPEILDLEGDETQFSKFAEMGALALYENRFTEVKDGQEQEQEEVKDNEIQSEKHESISQQEFLSVQNKIFFPRKARFNLYHRHYGKLKPREHPVGIKATMNLVTMNETDNSKNRLNNFHKVEEAYFSPDPQFFANSHQIPISWNSTWQFYERAENNPNFAKSLLELILNVNVPLMPNLELNFLDMNDAEDELDCFYTIEFIQGTKEQLLLHALLLYCYSNAKSSFKSQLRILKSKHGQNASFLEALETLTKHSNLDENLMDTMR